VLKIKLLLQRILPVIALIGLVFSAGDLAAWANNKNYARLFKVSDEAVLRITIPVGALRVDVWDRAEIKVDGRLQEETLELKDRQVGNSVEIEVFCSKVGRAELDAMVPRDCTLDLKCLKGPIEINGVKGQIAAQTTEGNILLNDIDSVNVTAKTISGNVSYQGLVDKSGIYNFQSVESLVEVALPFDSRFTLMATTLNGRVELGEFNNTDVVTKGKRLMGKHAGGGAMLNLSTQNGKIRLRRLK
jgi:hypothetical protein